MTNLVQSLFRIDPTEGLVQYVNAIKPFHSKVLDVLVEYIYSEKAAVTMHDRWSWVMSLTRPKVDVELSCGFGIVWDPFKTPSKETQATIKQAQSQVSMPLGIRLAANSTHLSVPQNGVSLVSGTRVTLVTNGTLPASIPQVSIGHTYIVEGHNSQFVLIDPVTSQPIDFLTNGQGTTFMHLVDLKFNSFLIEPNYGSSHTIAVTNIKSNQCTFVDTFNISAVSPSTKTWTISSDVRPKYDIIKIIHDDVSILPLDVAGNCCFVVDGNHEDYFPPGSTFVVTSTTSNNKTFTVADLGSGRLLTRYVGNSTIIPVDEVINSQDANMGVATVQLSVFIPPGSLIHIANNTGIGGNGRYTVVSTQTTAGTTRVVVDETISTLSAPDGNIHIPIGPSRMPQWPTGMQVGFSSTGTYPVPLSGSSAVYYAPTKTPGVFNLATKRYPSQLSDYVDLTSGHTGILKIQRSEMFWPGAYVKVSGSHLNKNDKNYIVSQTVPEGDNVRLYVMEKVLHNTPSNHEFDGIMEFNFDSYGAPAYCPVAHAPDLYTDTFIHEHISFEFTIGLSDALTATMYESRTHGWGTSPFGDGNEVDKSASSPIGRDSAAVGTILTTGIDMQLFGVGGLVETVESVSKNYGHSL